MAISDPRRLWQEGSLLVLHVKNEISGHGMQAVTLSTRPGGGVNVTNEGSIVKHAGVL